jgi:predicted nucleic acid-binding protein
MNIIDTSCWIEYLMNTSIGDVVAPIIENPTELIVPTITIYEVFKKLAAEKGNDYAGTVVSYMQSATVIPLDSKLSILSAKISRDYNLAMADSIIYASSLQ